MARTAVQSPRRDVPIVRRHGEPTQTGFDLLQDIVNALNGRKDVSGFLYTILLGLRITVGTGSPAGVVSGAIGDIYIDKTTGGVGAVVFYKTAGTVAAESTAGWQAVP